MKPGAVDIPVWVVYTGAGVLALGVGLLLWALLSDWLRNGRTKSRPRCPRCWYDMRGAQGLVCPECGRAAGSLGALLKSRRRWWWAMLGVVLMMVGGAASVSRTVARRGVIPYTPS